MLVLLVLEGWLGHQVLRETAEWSGKLVCRERRAIGACLVPLVSLQLTELKEIKVKRVKKVQPDLQAMLDREVVPEVADMSENLVREVVKEKKEALAPKEVPEALV